jgi:hypothetical protein
MVGNHEQLLIAILGVTARQAFPPDRLAELVAPKKVKGDKQVKAFNLCDGTLTQSEIAKALKLDQGNFSRTVSRWADAGIVFRLGEGREAKLLHVYPLPANGKSKERE